MRSTSLLALFLGCSLPASALNVVFILADDLGYGEVGCFGQEKIHTPNIDRLAKEGTKLTRHYSGAPVCAPARCTLMTGKHLGHAEIRGNRQASVSFPQFKEGQHRDAPGRLSKGRLCHRRDRQVGSRSRRLDRRSEQARFRPVLRLQLPGHRAFLLPAHPVAE